MTNIQSEYITPESVGHRYPSLTPRWLARRRWAHLPPSYVKAGKKVLYRISDIEDFLTSATQNTAATPKQGECGHDA